MDYADEIRLTAERALELIPTARHWIKGEEHNYTGHRKCLGYALICATADVRGIPRTVIEDDWRTELSAADEGWSVPACAAAARIIAEQYPERVSTVAPDAPAWIATEDSPGHVIASFNDDPRTTHRDIRRVAEKLQAS